MRRALPLLLLTTGCFKPYEDLAKLDFSEVAYESDFVTSEDAVIQAFDTELSCPDGEPARVFVAFRKSLTGAAPTALLLHSGAFDYIVQPDEADPIGGVHYRADSRLSRQWGIAKVWETLGLSRFPVDPEEASLGTLPATLVDAGYVVVLPANCWGDLWYGEELADPSDAEPGLSRYGGGFAQVMVDAMFSPETTAELGVRIPVSVNLEEVHLIGLGSGGRGAAQLLSSGANTSRSFRSVVIDSSPDLLGAYLADPLTWGPEIAGYEDIYGGALATIDQSSSIYALAQANALPARTAVIWSSLDTQVPAGAILPTGLAVNELGGGQVAVDSGLEGHVSSNRDVDLAANVVAYMTEGAVPEAEAPVR